VILQGVASSTLYWPADEVGSQTPGQLRPEDLSPCYTSSVGPTDRSAGLLVGRTHLSVTAVSLVGRDLGVPMSQKPVNISPPVGRRARGTQPLER
jgi:hypothetical protein